ncbi:MAG: N-acetyl-gamma-glutamyl-phosphate reductase [Candidatus Hadarchaeia archaeon]
MSVKISIVGASGYTGGELLRLLHNHPDAEVIGAYGKKTRGKKISELHTHLKGMYKLKIEKPNYSRIGNKSDLVFTATPHGTSMKFVPEILENGAKVIDISADYRLNDLETYEEYYQKHENPDVDAVYGLPEIHRDEIKNSDLVANPGCYPTAAILSLAPLLNRNMIDLDHIIIDSKSGSSGAGAKPSEKLHHPTCTDNVRAYNATTHRHNPEIDQEISGISGRKLKTHFTPHLLPMIRGILSTSHVFLNDSYSENEIKKIYEEFYKGEPFVRIRNNLPQTNNVRGSNYCDIGIRTSNKTNRATIISSIDNLVKGASGQAIQNMNILFGLREKRGLENLPLRP